MRHSHCREGPRLGDGVEYRLSQFKFVCILPMNTFTMAAKGDKVQATARHDNNKIICLSRPLGESSCATFNEEDFLNSFGAASSSLLQDKKILKRRKSYARAHFKTIIQN